ncbi:MAG: alpha/beta hydrolase, partial [Candidatus Binatia bacterium]
MSTNESGIEAVRGASGLVIDAVEQVTHVVEGMHAAIASVPGRAADVVPEKASGIAGFVYDVVRRVAGGVRFVLDGSLGLAAARVAPPLPQPHWDLVRSIVNGIVGDHLERSGNPLAIAMRLRRDGQP